MPWNNNDVKKWLKEFEDQIMDRKSIDILSHAHDLADVMVAFANNKFVESEFGGLIIIGLDNDGNIETFHPKQGHEELIMSVARDKIYPSIQPKFEKVDIDKKMVYVVTIPKMNNIPHQLITKNGKVYRIRVGSTIVEPTQDELLKLFSQTKNSNKPLKKIVNEEGIDLPADTSWVKLILNLGRKYMEKKHLRMNASIQKEINMLMGTGITLIITIVFTFFLSYHFKIFDISSFIYIALGCGIPAGLVFSIVNTIRERKCKNCGFNFAIELTNSKLVDEKIFKTSDGQRIREVRRNTYTCKFCNNKYTKNERFEYEK